MEIDYTYFFQNFDKAVILSDLQSGKIIDTNEKALSLFGKTAADFNNLKLTDVLPQKAIKSINEQIKTSPQNASEETFILDKDRNRIKVLINAQICQYEDNKYLIETLTPVDTAENSKYPDSEEIKKLINENEVKYKTLFETANDAIFLYKNGVIVEFNSRALEMFRATGEEISGKRPEDISPEKQPDGENSYKKANEKTEKVLTEGPQFFEWKHKRFNGTLFDSEVSLTSIKIEDEIYILAIIRDVTHRKRAEQALIQSKRSLSNLLKNLPGLAYRCKNDKSWTMEFISDGCFSLTGYHPDQLVNNKEKSYGSLILEEDIEETWEKIQKALENRESFKITYRIKTADGRIKWVWEQGSGVYSEKTGELLAIEGLINDITEQKIFEEAIQHSEAKFRSLVEESLVGVYIIQDGKFAYVNPKAAEYLGYSPEEITPDVKVESVIHPADREKVRENIARRLSGEAKTMHYHFRGLRKDKSLIELEVMGSLTVYNGKPAIIGTVIDVTDKNKTEKEIRKLSRAVEQSPASIIITDTDGNIEYVNKRFTEITGYTSEEVIGKNPRILKYGDSPPAYYKNLWDTIKSGNEWRGEFLNRKKNGELFWEFTSISPIKDSRGRITNFLAVKENITDRKNVEEELRIAKEKAEEMNRLKSVFLANMSHELRTPMVAILGYSEILKRELSNPELRDMALEIFESSHRLMNTLNLVLDLSKIESNREIVNYTELDVAAVAAEEFEFYKYLAVKKNLSFKTQVPDESITTLLDERMFRQIISSLVSNAVKFTSSGGVTLSVSKEIDDAGKNLVVIKVIDTGIGIPFESQKTIFEAFRQMSEGLNRSFEGAGLGLTVAKKFVEMLHGQISVESEFGKGSTFILKFPIIRKFDMQQTFIDHSQIPIEFPESGTEGGLSKILLVEDDQSNAGVIKFFLENYYDIDLALSGDIGVEKAKSVKYSAVLMDIDLGTGITGLEAAQQIKKIPGYSNTPIIAVTALAMRGDKEKFLSEGCTHYISKPFKKEDLINLVNDAVNQTM